MDRSKVLLVAGSVLVGGLGALAASECVARFRYGLQVTFYRSRIGAAAYLWPRTESWPVAPCGV